MESEPYIAAQSQGHMSYLLWWQHGFERSHARSVGTLSHIYEKGVCSLSRVGQSDSILGRAGVSPRQAASWWVPGWRILRSASRPRQPSQLAASSPQLAPLVLSTVAKRVHAPFAFLSLGLLCVSYKSVFSARAAPVAFATFGSVTCTQMPSTESPLRVGIKRYQGKKMRRGVDDIPFYS